MTDAVFQSDDAYATDAPHEIILNQIYGNTAEDTGLLRTHKDGKLRSQLRKVNGNDAEFPDALLEKKGKSWVVKAQYAQLSYLQKEGKLDTLRKKNKGKEADL